MTTTASTGNDLLTAALDYAGRGFAVFPLKRRGKKPATYNGFYDATTDPGQLAEEWARKPESNVGIATGAASGFVVLDVDGADGEASLSALLNGDGLPLTPTSSTSRGMHLLFAHPGEPVRSKAGLKPGLDVRGDGGYIVAPPSVHPNGSIYAWADGRSPEEVGLAPMPPWLLAALAPKRTARPATNGVPPRSAGAGSASPWALKALRNECETVAQAARGTRNHTLNAAAYSLGQLIGGGSLNREHIEAELYAAAEGCKLVDDDGEKSVRDTIASGIKGGMAKPRSESPPRSEPPPRANGRKATTRPTIFLRPELGPVTDEAEAALVADPDTDIYFRSRMLVHVVGDTGERRRGILREPESPVIERLSADALRERMDRSAEWVKRSAAKRNRDTGEVTEWKELPAMPPEWAVRTLISRREWRFPYLEAVVEQPTMKPDGELLTGAGYDADSGLVLIPSARFPAIPDRPTWQEVIAAAARLLEPFADFPFVTGSDRATAVAAVLTLVARAAIDGCVPMFPVRAPAPGTGKGLLADVVCVIGTGRPAARMTLPSKDDELRKAILAVALEGLPAVLLDNVDRAIGSQSLAAAITAMEWRDRLLGVSEIVSAPLRATWIATGNGLTFRGDLARRVLPIDLDAQLERPEDRNEFSHPNLLAWTRQRRPQLVADALTVLRGYHVAGRPKHGRTRMGSFEAWDDLVRGACVWTGLGDPCAGTERIRSEDDSDLAALAAVLEAWAEAFGDTPKTASEAITAAGDGSSLPPTTRDPLRDAVLGLTGRDKLTASVLGYALRKVKGRLVGGRLFTTVETNRRQPARWRLTSRGGGG